MQKKKCVEKKGKGGKNRKTKVYEQEYRYYNSVMKWTYITMVVTFLESEYFFSSSLISNSSIQGEL